MADDETPDEVDAPAEDERPAEDEAPAEDAPADSGTHDESVCAAAIAARDATIGERDGVIATLTADLAAQKVANYDLLMSMPSEDTDEGAADVEDSSEDSGDYAELFGV